jgi:hypothetical protein
MPNEMSLDGFEDSSKPAAKSASPSGMDLDEFQESDSQPLKHISHSQISSYIRCPMVTFWRYVRNKKSPPASAISFGLGTHKALEYNFAQKIYSKQDVPVSVVTDIFRDFWKQAAPITVFDTEKDEKADDFLDQGTVLLAKYHKEHSPHIQPAAVETRFTLQLPGVPREVLGFIDLITGPQNEQNDSQRAHLGQGHAVDALSYGLPDQVRT